MPANAAHPGVNAGISFAMLRAAVTPFGRLGCGRCSPALLSAQPRRLAPRRSRAQGLQRRVRAPARHGRALRHARPLAFAEELGEPASSAHAAPRRDAGSGTGCGCRPCRRRGARQEPGGEVRGQALHPRSSLCSVSPRVPRERAGAVDQARRRHQHRGPRGHGAPVRVGSDHLRATRRWSTEPAPLVNVLRVRENGPLALHADTTSPARVRACASRSAAAAPPRTSRTVTGLTRRSASTRAAGRLPRKSTPLASRNGRTRDQAATQRAAARERQPRDLLGRRPHRKPRDEGRALPLRRLREQALLRRYPRAERLRLRSSSPSARLAVDSARCPSRESSRVLRRRSWAEHYVLCSSLGVKLAPPYPPTSFRENAVPVRLTRTGAPPSFARRAASERTPKLEAMKEPHYRARTLHAFASRAPGRGAHVLGDPRFLRRRARVPARPPPHLPRRDPAREPLPRAHRGARRSRG